MRIGNNVDTDQLTETWAARQMADDAYLDALRSGRLIRETPAAHQLAFADFAAPRQQVMEKRPHG
jgi:hypothetical protein